MLRTRNPLEIKFLTPEKRAPRRLRQTPRRRMRRNRFALAAGAASAVALFAHGLLSPQPSADEENSLDCEAVKAITVPYKGKLWLVVPPRAAANPLEGLLGDYISLYAQAPREVQGQLPLIRSISTVSHEDRNDFPGILIDTSSPTERQRQILERAMERLLEYMGNQCPHNTYLTGNNPGHAPGLFPAA